MLNQIIKKRYKSCRAQWLYEKLPQILNKYKIIMILVKIAQNYFVLIFYNFLKGSENQLTIFAP